MAVGIPADVDTIEPEIIYMRRNSTGSLGIEMSKSKVLSRYLSPRRSSCHDLCKGGMEYDLETKERIPLHRRSVATLGKIPELVPELDTTVIKKKPLSSTKLPLNVKGRITCQDQGQEIPASTKRLAVSVNQSGLKQKTLEENAHSVSRSNKLGRTRKSDIIVPGVSPIPQESLLDGARCRTNKGSQTDNDTGFSELSKKKATVPATNSSAKRVSVTKSSNNSPGVVSQLDNRSSLPQSKTRKVNHEDVPNKVSQPNTWTNLARDKIRQPNHENIPKKASQLNKGASLKEGKTGCIKEPKIKSQIEGIPPETRKAKNSSLNRDGQKEGKTASSPPSSTLPTDGSSSRDNTASLPPFSPPSDGSNSIKNGRKGGNTASSPLLSPSSSPPSSSGSSRNIGRKGGKTTSPPLLSPSSSPPLYGGSSRNVGPKGGKTASSSRPSTSSSLRSDGSSSRNVGPKGGKTASSPLLSPSSPLHSDECSSRNIASLSRSSSSLISLSSSGCEDLDGDTSSRKSGTTKQNKHVRAPRVARVYSRNEDSIPKKLKFRRVNMIDFQSERVAPRRLKFKPVKILDKSRYENAGFRGRGFQRLIADGKSNAARDEGMKQVNLRPQSRRDKQDSSSLFNNVIEETATKLVETRRSKVKALVGAFETLISLHVPKSSPRIWRC